MHSPDLTLVRINLIIFLFGILSTPCVWKKKKTLITEFMKISVFCVYNINVDRWWKEVQINKTLIPVVINGKNCTKAIFNAKTVMLKKAFYFTQYKQNKLKIVFVPQNMKNSSLSSVRVFLNKKYNNNHNKKTFSIGICSNSNFSLWLKSS